jgi:hypothetical protein
MNLNQLSKACNENEKLDEISNICYPCEYYNLVRDLWI